MFRCSKIATSDTECNEVEPRTGWYVLSLFLGKDLQEIKSTTSFPFVKLNFLSRYHMLKNYNSFLYSIISKIMLNSISLCVILLFSD